MVALLRVTNRALDRIDPKGADRVREAIARTTSLPEAVRQAGLLDGVELDGSAVEDALAGLPSSVAAATLAALRDAVDRDVPAVLQWKPGAAAEVQVWEAVEDGVGQIGILLVTPYGRVLAQGASAG